MLNIKKILLPIDFPNTWLPVVHQAATLAHHFHSEIVMLHVVTAQSHAAGVPVAQAARRLGVSVPTVRSWIARGALAAIEGSSPVEIEPESLRSVGRALDELRERGQDREWLAALVDYLDDRQARQSPALREGLAQLARGELEPA